MELRQLRYFLGIVEQGSLSAAAEVLHIAQPALSLHLKRLEAEFGCQLVHRTSKGVVVTESGQRLVQRARMLIDEMNALRDDVRGLEAVPSGYAVVGIPTSLGRILTVPLVKEIRARFPGIRLRVIEGLSGHMQEWLVSGLADLAVIFNVSSSQGFTSYPLAQEELCLVAGRADALLNGRMEIGMDAVLDLPLILPGLPHGVREEVDHAARGIGRKPNVIVEVDALDQIKSLVAEGVGYTVLSRRYAQMGQISEHLSIVPIVRPIIRRSICLAHSVNRPLSIAAKVVLRLLSEIFSTVYFESTGSS